MTKDNVTNRVERAAEIVAAYVSYNPMAATSLPDFVRQVLGAIVALEGPKPAEPKALLQPAVPINMSITNEYLICLDDGRKFRSLKRHIALLGMTPNQYRTKWGLPPDYPMTAAGYSQKRSDLAKRIGLGRKRYSG